MANEFEQARARPLCLREDAIEVLKRLRDAGHVAYFAGGCVRDLLLHLEPKDFDVATDATPTRVRELFSRTQAVGAAFGVILVRARESVIEVATFRTEGEYHDGRHPDHVKFATAEQDAQRRDFTINGLFLDPIEDRVVDYVDGQKDLRERTLRAIGDPADRFAEDHLRLLRAVRFAARFDLNVEPATAEAIQRESSKLRRITPERIADELRLILTPPTRFAAGLLLWQFGLSREIFRHLATPPNPQPLLPPERSIFLSLVPGMPVTFSLSLLAAVLDYLHANAPHSDIRQFLVAAEMQKIIRVLRQDLKISNVETDAITDISSGVTMLLGETSPTLAQRKRFLAMASSRQSLDLLRALATAGHHTARAASEERALRPLIGTEVAPLPLISGDDLKSFGLAPGPLFKRILDFVYDAQLEGRIVDFQSAKTLAIDSASEGKGQQT